MPDRTTATSPRRSFPLWDLSYDLVPPRSWVVACVLGGVLGSVLTGLWFCTGYEQ